MNNTPQPNVELINKVIEQIDAHPETWCQDLWARKTDCGTSYCFAGWACVLAGEEILWNEHKVGEDTFAAHVRTQGCASKEFGEYYVTIRERAQQLLGLGVIEADLLFDWANDREEIQEQVNQVLARAEAT
jgi:hypothetical protein